jgi:hypothetical protein
MNKEYARKVEIINKAKLMEEAEKLERIFQI